MLERLNSAGVKVTIRRSDKARRISISIKRSGEVTLVIPKRGDEEQALQFLESKSEAIISALRRLASKPKSPTLTQSEIEGYIRSAKAYLPQRIRELAASTNLRYNHLTITGARTRWGSCSSQNRISLSYHLMRLEKHLIDFVIIHELCHTVHHNHSATFHALVNLHTQGREAQLNKELRQFKI